MKKILLFVLFSLSLIANELNWINDFEEAKTLAKKEDKTIMMFISSPTCHVCNYMKEKVFTVQEIQDFMTKNFILFNVELGMDEPPKGFTYIGTPTTYFLNEDGSKIGNEIIGGTKPGFYIKKLRPYVKK